MLEIDLLIEKKREEMYLNINKYGIRDIRTIIVSQELDELLVSKQRIAA